MLQVHSWPNVILHLDADAFFASVIQAVYPNLKGRPVVAGAERGIATAVSYEARKYGIKRGMRSFEIRKLCPNCVIMHSDYETYGLFSQRMFNVLRSFSPTVEEYSIDEGFADLKGLRRPLKMGYYEIGKAIKDRIESSLGITISVGISLTKSLAKLSSSFKKPSGLTVTNGLMIEDLLKQVPVKDVWGIGPQSTAYLNKLGVSTAFDFIQKPEEYIQKHFSKPYLEIWHELRGDPVYGINTAAKTTYRSITRSRTFTPPSADRDFLWSQVLRHVEEAFTKIRELNYRAGRVIIYLKTQQFNYHAVEIKIKEGAVYPFMIRQELHKGFDRIYKSSVQYRTAGCTVADLVENQASQPTLFTDLKREEKARKIYPLVENKKVDFGVSLFGKRKTHEKEKKKMELPVISLKLA